jgi:hypothetical protein
MTKKDLFKYEDSGWKFKESHDISHHNGDREDQLLAKSPRLKSFFVVSGSRHSIPKWNDAKEEKLLKLESRHWAEEKWMEIRKIVEFQVNLGLREGKQKIEIDINADYSNLVKKYYE